MQLSDLKSYTVVKSGASVAPAAAPAPHPADDLLSNAGKVVNSIFPGAKVGEAIGTEAAKVLAAPDAKKFVEPGPTAGQVLGDATEAAAFFAPVGEIAGAVGAGAKALGAGEKLAPAIGKLAAGLGTGYAVDTTSHLAEGKTGAEALVPGAGTAVGGAIPAVGETAKIAFKFAEGQGPRIINSLIKPLAKDFSYGKNPGRAVAEAGIVANNFEDLAAGISEARQTTGRAIGSLGSTLSTKPIVQLGDALSPLDDAMRTAANQNNPTLLQRLQAVKTALTHVLEPQVDEEGKIGIKTVSERNLSNLTFAEARDVLRSVGDVTQFTGNPSDDKSVNSALKSVYGSIKQSTLEAARTINPEAAAEFEKLTEKYADLTSAEIATKYRDKIVQRANLVGLSPTTAALGTGLLTAIATGGAAVPAIAAGLAGGAIDKLAASPGFKTRLAAALSKKSPEEAGALFKAIPALRTFFPKSMSLTPGDRVLRGK